jgi:nucleotide-binding universal stress UspA family protein
MKNEILVPLDGTPEAESILPAARTLAAALPARIRLVSVLERADVPPDRRAYLEQRRLELAGRKIDAGVEVAVGRPAESILEFARGAGTDFIAMTTHGRRGMDRLVLGSVAEEVLRRSPVPLLVARPGQPPAAGRRLLVALDGSPAGEAVLPDAVRLARGLAWPIDLVRVALPIAVPGGLGEPLVPLPSDDPMPYLEALRKRLETEGGLEVRPVALEGRAATQILIHAREAGAGLLCLTTHGRTGLARLVMGSIAEELLRTAPCPVWARRSA